MPAGLIFTIDADDNNSHCYNLVDFKSLHNSFQVNTTIDGQFLECGQIVVN